MTDADLERLLHRAAWRLRLEAALRHALAAGSVALLCAAGGIFALRLNPLNAGLSAFVQQSLLALPVLISVLAFILTCVRLRPDLEHVALRLDRRAGSLEHLVTWLHFQPRATALPERQREFVAAQREATLNMAAKWNVAELVPIRLPEWARAVWLALLLLCCALLMPPRQTAAERPERKALQRADALLNGVGAAAGGADAARSAPRVQVLQPTELMKINLLATDPDAPAELKTQALKELLGRIGTVPESELAPEVRELLNLLRAETGAPAPTAASELKNGASVQKTSRGSEAGNSTSGEAGTAARLVPFRERAASSAGQQFSDIQEPLERYYGSGKGEEKRGP